MNRDKLMEEIASMSRGDLEELAMEALINRKETKQKPMLDRSLHFRYRDRDFELNSCHVVEHDRPAYTDRYVCWEFYENDDGAFEYTLIPNAWLWGASEMLLPGMEVDPYILECIDGYIDN